MSADRQILLFEPEPVLRQRILELLCQNLQHVQCRAAENLEDIQGFLRTSQFDVLIVDFSQLGPRLCNFFWCNFRQGVERVAA